MTTENSSTTNVNVTESKPKKRGFANWSRDRVMAVAQKGGKAAHLAGTAHEFTREEAVLAGRKGAQASIASRRLAKAGTITDSRPDLRVVK